MQGMPPEALAEVAAYFQTLAEPTRLSILNLLRDGLAMARNGELDAVREMALELAAWFAKHTQTMDAELALHMRRQPEPRRRTRAPGKTVGGPTR